MPRRVPEAMPRQYEQSVASERRRISGRATISGGDKRRQEIRLGSLAIGEYAVP